jgi:hypothetical protein
MNWDWQNLAVLAVILAAAGYLSRLAWLTVVRRRAAACGSCPTCPAAAAKDPEVFGIAAGQSTRSRD